MIAKQSKHKNKLRTITIYLATRKKGEKINQDIIVLQVNLIQIKNKKFRLNFQKKKLIETPQRHPSKNLTQKMR